MSQAQATEIQGPFSREFSGLNTSSAVNSLEPSASPVFHNCDVSDDGAVVRRKGTALVDTYDLVTTDGACWTETIRTKLGSEYFVLVNSTGLIVSLMRDNEVVGMPAVMGTVSKANIWTQVPSSMQFISVNAPYDRLIILTGNHPIIQLSFLERQITANCTGVNVGGNTASFTASLSANDTTLWRDTNAPSYLVTDNVGNTYTLQSKASGFTFTLNATGGGGFVSGQSYNLVIRQITWQWWAESMYYEGADFFQTVNRVNVTNQDTNVAVPRRLYTDLDPLYFNSQGMGLYAYSSQDFTVNSWVGPLRRPQTEPQYGFSTGGIFDFTSASSVLNNGPFFVTFGRKFTDSTIVSPVIIQRIRELRTRGGLGNSPTNLDVWLDNTRFTWSGTHFTNNNFHTWIKTESVGERTITPSNNVNQVAAYWGFMPLNNNISFTNQVHIADTEGRTWFGSANANWYRGITSGSLDGTYVRAYGIDRFVDYSKRSFHAIGTIYRDRLVLVNPNTSQDQLVVSESGDESVPGEYYQFFQVTDMLQGVVSDPFTVNVTSEPRDIITALTSWQGNVFVFTNNNTYSIAGGEQFGESSYAVNLVSTYGAFNQRCVAVTNLTVLYMNRFGIFDLTNKPNTDNYGAFERTVNIRSSFSDLGGSVSDQTHWLQYNETTNKLYVGLALSGDTRTTSRLLVLNVTWNSWSTFSSAAPFLLYPACQLFRYTLFLASVTAPRHLALLCTEMPFYLDYAQVRASAFPFNFTAGVIDFSQTSDSRGIFNLALPVTPGINDYAIAASNKLGKVYRLNSQLPGTSAVRMRNVMLDYANLFELLGLNTNASLFGLATPNNYEPFTVYPTVNPSGVNPQRWTVTGASGFVNRPVVNQPSVVVGMIYPSVYASPVFDLESLGRLKRLKKLHLQLDTTVVNRLSYNLASQFSGVKVLNCAMVSVISNYNENVVPIITQYTTDNVYEARQTVQLSLPLQGYGCDYQFYISSVGAEAFKLAAFEFDIQPQRDKRYVRQ